MNTNEIFIENGRFHGRQIAQDVLRKLGGPTTDPWVRESVTKVEATPPATHLRNAE
jgi:hypothetical protein